MTTASSDPSDPQAGSELVQVESFRIPDAVYADYTAG